MTEHLSTTYKGETITFSEFNEDWRWQHGCHASLKKVKEQIDRLGH